MALDKAQRKTFWATVRLLRALAPPPDGLPVRVRITDVPGDRLADCSRRPTHYLIRISRNELADSPEIRYLVLAHEFAHVLAWSDESDHGDSWGIALARVWRIIMEEQEPGDLSRALPSD